MVAGAKPFEEFNKDMSEKMGNIEKGLSSNIDVIHSKVDIILDDLSMQEKKRVYDLNSNYDVSSLDEDEKEYALALLYTISQLIEEPSEMQKQYVLRVQRYLEVRRPQLNINLSSIENIENISTQKILYQFLLEYLFLFNETLEEVENSEEVKEIFGYFSVNNNTQKSIKTSVETIYKATGAYGLIEKYGYEVYEEVYEEVTEDLQVDDLISDSSEASLNDSSKPILGPIGGDQLEEIYINLTLRINSGENRIFENSIVHINSLIDCRGELLFDNCTIYYNESSSLSEIRLGNDSLLKFSQSKIICAKKSEKFLIDGDSAQNIEFQNCDFYSCTHLINCKNNSNLLINNCEINDPGENFLDCGSNNKVTVLISNSYINFMEKPEKRDRAIFGNFELGPSRHPSKIIIQECRVKSDTLFTGDSSYSSSIFEMEGAIYQNCDFLNISNCIRGDNKIIKCTFTNCKSVIHYSRPIFKVAEVTDCLFDSCEDVLDLLESTKVSSCQFINCKKRLIRARNVDIRFCEFYNIVGKKVDMTNDNGFQDACIEFTVNKDHNASVMHRCVFNGVDLDSIYLIEGQIIGKVFFEVAVKIEECSFYNCHTEREDKKIIKDREFYYGLFNRRVDATTASITDCTGLDEINKGTKDVENYIIKKENSLGEIIGSSMPILIG